ncbi:MAG TPA: alpha/beta fold hydrolase [Caldimonas sp.]|jgi:pimeloyl-ACP methyl ester carboxylesterase|nr:alpha/beta fold hydrolase [Caldimonas sp.]HEX2542409.1 alpha/beta fold hydrolase [Caldimonas sp.]
MHLNHVRLGSGKPLLLVHGLGGSWRSWEPILAPLSAQREVIAVDLPGFGGSAPLDELPSIGSLATALASFIAASGLQGVDAVGSSLGARVILELGRRGGSVGAIVALDAGGFWEPWERHAFFASTWLSMQALRAMRPLLPVLARSGAGRALLLARLSARPVAVPPEMALQEMRGYASTPAGRRLIFQLAYREPDLGAPPGALREPVVIGWGRHDRIFSAAHARRALALFPDARLHWFEHCGHFPQWDAPDATVRLILETTGTRGLDDPVSPGRTATSAAPPPGPGAGDHRAAGGASLRSGRRRFSLVLA